MRIGLVYLRDRIAGSIVEDEHGFHFRYSESWLRNPDAEPVSLTLPLREEEYVQPTMFPFFDGLIPEGWMLDIAVRQWKLDARDRMGLLLACCRDCIGAVGVVAAPSDGSGGESGTEVPDVG